MLNIDFTTAAGLSPFYPFVPTPNRFLCFYLDDQVCVKKQWDRDFTTQARSIIMAPEYVRYNPGNGSCSCAEELAYVGSWASTTVKVNRYGNTAITMATSTFSGVAKGKAFSNAIQMMIAWVLHDGQWQMAVVQSKHRPGQPRS